MRVTLTTHGGQAAAINLRRPARVLDTDSLPDEAAHRLRRLVEAAASGESGDTRSPGAARDAMSYRITVDDGGSPTTLTGTDVAMSPAFAELLTWIQQATR